MSEPLPVANIACEVCGGGAVRQTHDIDHVRGENGRIVTRILAEHWYCAHHHKIGLVKTLDGKLYRGAVEVKE